jgi:poly(hydroxyalkanoate) granule-associated protein
VGSDEEGIEGQRNSKKNEHSHTHHKGGESDMSDLIRKALFAGIGAVALTKEKAEELVDELIKRGEVASEERPKIVQDLLGKAEETKKEWSGKVEKVVKETVEKLGIPAKAELDALSQKIDALTAEVEKMGKSAKEE